jgi:FkbM family methyltransferase
MYLRSVLQMAALTMRFRNGWHLVERMRAGLPCSEVILWDGTSITHPPERGGLLEAVVEVWLEHTYTADFYHPSDGDVIVDAGANVGVFAIWIARQNRHLKIVALEPFAENFRYLQANVKQARLKTITCQEVALGAAFSRGRMHAVGSRSLDHVLEPESDATGGVPVIPLSGLLELTGSGEIDLLKVDIEGSEHGVFAGASSESLRPFKRIAMEYHDQIVPGTLDMLQRVLAPTHEIIVRPAKMAGCGILLASRRDLKS